MDTPKYVELDGAWHQIVEGEQTACGEPVPFGSTWVGSPDGAAIHCGENATKPKAKKR